MFVVKGKNAWLVIIDILNFQIIYTIKVVYFNRQKSGVPRSWVGQHLGRGALAHSWRRHCIEYDCIQYFQDVFFITVKRHINAKINTVCRIAALRIFAIVYPRIQSEFYNISLVASMPASVQNVHYGFSYLAIVHTFQSFISDAHAVYA